MDTKILEEIGFTKGEVKVYFALMELGESTIGSIARKAGVTPAKTYTILDKLKDKGLITHVIKDNTKYFQAFNPGKIINFLDEKKKKIEQEKQEINKIIPQLISKQKKEAEQSATVYESFNGIKTLYNEILDCLSNSKEDFIGFTLGEEYEDKDVNLFFKNYDVKRKELGIKVKLIGLRNQRNFFKKKYKPSKNVKIKYVDYSVPTGILIYEDKVATLIWKKVPTAFVIQSKENAKSYRTFFEDMWKIAKP